MIILKAAKEWDQSPACQRYEMQIMEDVNWWQDLSYALFITAALQPVWFVRVLWVGFSKRKMSGCGFFSPCLSSKHDISWSSQIFYELVLLFGLFFFFLPHSTGMTVKLKMYFQLFAASVHLLYHTDASVNESLVKQCTRFLLFHCLHRPKSSKITH